MKGYSETVLDSAGAISRHSWLQSKKVVVADLDDTLAPSKSRISNDVAAAINEFLKSKKLVVISGGRYAQFERQLLEGISKDPELLENLYLFPTNAACMYVFRDGSWEMVYKDRLRADEKSRIFDAFDKALALSGYERPKMSYGEIIEDRETQITFSALGNDAPLEEKRLWDPDQKKRLCIRDNMLKLAPEFEIRIGGTTSIDVTRKGIDKAYGIEKISEMLNTGVKEMLFIGDALFEGGNDYAARKTGIDCLQVSDPGETAEILRAATKHKERAG